MDPIARATMQIDGPVGSYFQITLADTGAEPRNTYAVVRLRTENVEARNPALIVTEIVAMEV